MCPRREGPGPGAPNDDDNESVSGPVSARSWSPCLIRAYGPVSVKDKWAHLKKKSCGIKLPLRHTVAGSRPLRSITDPCTRIYCDGCPLSAMHVWAGMGPNRQQHA